MNTEEYLISSRKTTMESITLDWQMRQRVQEVRHNAANEIREIQRLRDEQINRIINDYHMQKLRLIRESYADEIKSITTNDPQK